MSIAGEEETFEVECHDYLPKESEPVFDTGVGEWLHGCALCTMCELWVVCGVLALYLSFHIVCDCVGGQVVQ